MIGRYQSPRTFWKVTFNDDRSRMWRQVKSKRYFSEGAMRNACRGRGVEKVEEFQYFKVGERDHL